MTVADAEAVARLMADPAVFGNLMQLPYPSAEQWARRIAENPLDGPDLSLCAERDGVLVGSAGLHAVPRVRRRHAAMLGISVAAEAQRQGVGTALMQALCDHADRWAQLLRLELTVFADNAHAIRLYERFGFVVEGRHRAYALRDGEYVDVLSMARLHPRPPQLPALPRPESGR